MKQISRESPTGKVRVESHNPLWIITAMIALFFAVAAILIAWG